MTTNTNRQLLENLSQRLRQCVRQGFVTDEVVRDELISIRDEAQAMNHSLLDSFIAADDESPESLDALTDVNNAARIAFEARRALRQCALVS